MKVRMDLCGCDWKDSNMEKKMRECIICGASFIPVKSTQLYCSTCGADPRRARQKLERAVCVNRRHAGDITKYRRRCPNCGKWFLSVDQTFCSAECDEEYRTSKPKECIVCGKALADDQKYDCCSEKCIHKLQFLIAAGDKRYGRCKKCGKIFRKKNALDEYCSKRCEPFLWAKHA